MEIKQNFKEDFKMEETRNDVEIEINNEEDFVEETVEEKSRLSKCKSFVRRHAKKIGTAGLFLAVGCIGYALGNRNSGESSFETESGLISTDEDEPEKETE